MPEITNSLQLYRTLPLNDSENTQLFTFKLGLLNLDEFKAKSVRSTIINYQGQDWYLSCKYAEGKRHEFLGVYIYWGSPAEGVRCRADFRIITRNVLDPTKSLVTEGSQVEFSAPQSPGWGKREFAPLRELFTPGQGFLLEPEKIVIIELAMKSCSTLFEQSVDFAQLLSHREQPYPSFFTANFPLAGMEFYVSLYPLGDREEAEGHVSMYLHRFLGNENEVTQLGCRIRFRFFLGHSRTCPSNSKTFEFSFKNEQGYGRFKAFEPLNGSDNLLFRGSVPLGVEIVSVTPFAQPEIRLATRGYYHTDNFMFEDASFPDHRGNMWRLSASSGTHNLSLRLNAEDKNRLFAAQGLVPVNQARIVKREECTKFLQWRAFVLSRTDRKKTLSVNGCPLSAYYSRGLNQTSFNMSTQIPLSKAKALDGDYCTKDEPSLLVRIEFLNVQDLCMMSDYPTLDFERFQLYHTREGLKRCLKQNELLVRELETLHGKLTTAMKENKDSKDLVNDFQKLIKMDSPLLDLASDFPLPSPSISSSLPSSPPLPPPPPPLEQHESDNDHHHEHDQPVPRFPPKRDNFQLMKWLLQQQSHDSYDSIASASTDQEKGDNLNDPNQLLMAQKPSSRPASISSSPILNAQPPVPRPRGQRGPPPRPPPRAYSPVATDLVNTRQFSYSSTPTPLSTASPSPTASTPPLPQNGPPHSSNPMTLHGPPLSSSAGMANIGLDSQRLAALNSNDTAFKRFSFTGINITPAMISKETSETAKKEREEVPAQSSSGGKEPESPLPQLTQHQQQKNNQQSQQQQEKGQQRNQALSQDQQKQQKNSEQNQQQQRQLYQQQLQQQQKQLNQQQQQLRHQQQLYQQQIQKQQMQGQNKHQENGMPSINGSLPPTNGVQSHLNGSQPSSVVMSKMGDDGMARGFALARLTRPPVNTSQPRVNNPPLSQMQPSSSQQTSNQFPAPVQPPVPKPEGNQVPPQTQDIALQPPNNTPSAQIQLTDAISKSETNSVPSLTQLQASQQKSNAQEKSTPLPAVSHAATSQSVNNQSPTQMQSSMTQATDDHTPPQSPPADTESQRLSWPQGLSVKFPQTSQSTGALEEEMKSLASINNANKADAKLPKGNIGTKAEEATSSSGFQSNLHQSVSSPNIASSVSGSRSREGGPSTYRNPVRHRPSSTPPSDSSYMSGFSFSPVPESILNRRSPVPEDISPPVCIPQVSASANQHGQHNQQGQGKHPWSKNLPHSRNPINQRSDDHLNQAPISGGVVPRDHASQQNGEHDESARHTKSTPNSPSKSVTPVTELTSKSTPTSPTRQNGLPNGHLGSPSHRPQLPQPPPPPTIPPAQPRVPPSEPSQLQQTSQPQPSKSSATSLAQSSQQPSTRSYIPKSLNDYSPPSSPPPPPPTQDTKISVPPRPAHVPLPITTSQPTIPTIPPRPIQSPQSPLSPQAQQNMEQHLGQGKMNGRAMPQQQTVPNLDNGARTHKSIVSNGSDQSNGNTEQQQSNHSHHGQRQSVHIPDQQQQSIPQQIILKTPEGNGTRLGNGSVNKMALLPDQNQNEHHQNQNQNVALTNGTNGLNGTNGTDGPDNGSRSPPPRPANPPAVVVRKKQRQVSSPEDLTKRLSIPTVQERQRLGIIETSL